MFQKLTKIVIGFFITAVFITGVHFYVNSEHRQFEKILCQADISACGLKSLTRINKGVSGAKIYHLITQDNQEYVLRFFSDRKTKEQKEAEIQAFKIAEFQGLTPKLYWSDPEIGILMAYLKPHQNNAVPAMKKAKSDIANILKTLHQLEGFPKSENKFEEIQKFHLANLKTYAEILPENFQEIESKLHEIAPFYIPLIDHKAMHGDVNPSNILFANGGYKLIDWEYAHSGDPYFDLGSFAFFMDFDEEENKAFLTAYFDREPTDLEKAKYHFMIEFSKAFYGIATISSVFRDRFSEESERQDMMKTLFDRQKKNWPRLKDYKGKTFLDVQNRNAIMDYGLVLINDFLLSMSEDENMEILKIFKDEKQFRDFSAYLKEAKIENPKILSIEPIAEGMSDAGIFKIKTEDKHDYILRLFSPDRSLADREREILAFSKASQAEIAPQLYWWDQNIGMLIDFIDVKQPLPKMTEKIHQDDASLLIKLHALQGFSEVPLPIDVIKTVFEPVIFENITIDKKLFDMHSLALNELRDLYKNKMTLKAIHGDLNPNNILFDGQRSWIVDWEIAGISDPNFDLAAYSIFHLFNPIAQNKFLATYYGKPLTDIENARFILNKSVAKSFYGTAILYNIFKNELHSDKEKQDFMTLLNDYQKRDFETLNEFWLRKGGLKSKDDIPKLAIVLLRDALFDMDTVAFKEALKVLND